MPTKGRSLSLYLIEKIELVFDMRILGWTKFQAWNKPGNLVQSETFRGVQGHHTPQVNLIRKTVLRGPK